MDEVTETADGHSAGPGRPGVRTPDAWPEDLPTDAAATSSALTTAEREVRVAESRRVVLVAHWLDLHAPHDVDGPVDVRLVRGAERFVPAGADGTPLVGEFACAELGALLGLYPAGARALMAKVANLRHRHPRLWARLRRGEVAVWKALETARLVGRRELGLTPEQAEWIDDRSSERVTTLPWAAYVELLEQLIVDADPIAAQQRADVAASRQGVWTTRSTEEGLKTLVARAAAGEITYLIAVTDHLAEALAERGDTRSIDARRASALALLAHPAHALAVLAEHAAAHASDVDDDSDGADDDASDGHGDFACDRGAGGAHHHDECHRDGTPALGHEDPEADEVGPQTCPHHSAASVSTDPQETAEPEQPIPSSGPPRRGQWSYLTVPAEVAGALSLLQRPDVLERLLPQATLYLHLDRQALETNSGPARVEGHSVITADQARRWLGHRRVTVTPVVDLDAHHDAVSGYQFPRRLREVMHLTSGGRDGFPFGTAGRPGWHGKDADHVRPYRPPSSGGPPGQTGLHNGVLLSRFSHRLKTHGRWRLHQLDRGAYLWQAPHGSNYLVDALGTHPVPPAVVPWLLRMAEGQSEGAHTRFANGKDRIDAA